MITAVWKTARFGDMADGSFRFLYYFMQLTIAKQTDFSLMKSKRWRLFIVCIIIVYCKIVSVYLCLCTSRGVLQGAHASPIWHMATYLSPLIPAQTISDYTSDTSAHIHPYIDTLCLSLPPNIKIKSLDDVSLLLKHWQCTCVWVLHFRVIISNWKWLAMSCMTDVQFLAGAQTVLSTAASRQALGTHPVYPVGTRRSFLGVKMAAVWRWSLTSI
jgi:hypothetical protein